MSFKDDFLAKKDQISQQESLFKIRQQYSFQNNTLHLFLEADDDFEFYKKSVETVYPEFKIYAYPKYGKKHVSSTFDIFDWNKYSKSRILFFVDKDYEDILGYASKKGDNFFVTKFYSIENYISSVEIFHYCLKNIFKIKYEPIISRLCTKYEEGYMAFQMDLKLLTAIILIYRENSSHIDLDKIKMDDFFIINGLTLHRKKYKNTTLFNRLKRGQLSGLDKSLVVAHKKLTLVKRCVEDETLITREKISSNLIKLDAIEDSRIYIRGKYHLWFFSNFFSNIRSAAQQINSEIHQANVDHGLNLTNINLGIEINESNIFDILPMKINTHEDVIEFLMHNKISLNA